MRFAAPRGTRYADHPPLVLATGCVLLMDGRWNLTSCNPGDDGLASVPGVVPLCEARPTPRTLTELQAEEAGLVGTAELPENFWKAMFEHLRQRDQRASSTSANTFGVVVDLEGLVRDCAGGRNTDKGQEGAFLYVRDSETLRSINGRRSNGMHRIYACGEQNSGKVRYDSKQSQHMCCATLHDTTHHTHV